MNNINQNRNYPLITIGENPDERTEGVILLEESEYDKTTARDCGDYWYITDWEIYNHDDELHWFDRSSYTISKDIIKKLGDIPCQL